MVVAVLCPGNREHRLWLCEGRGIGGKGQRVYGWIKHSPQLCDWVAKPRNVNRSSNCMMSFIMNPGHDSLIYFYSSCVPCLFPLRFWHVPAPFCFQSFPWEFTTVFLLSLEFYFPYSAIFSRSPWWLVQIAHDLVRSCNKLGPHCSRHQSVTDKQRILNVSSFFFFGLIIDLIKITVRLENFHSACNYPICSTR